MASLTIFAPAKINLFLHVTGKCEDGYHTLQSLVAFANVGDHIEIEKADKYSLQTNNTNISEDKNIITKATYGLAELLNRNPNVSINLKKEIPMGAGLGGGSSDAAATIRGLLELWKENVQQETLNALLTALGADVPACYHQKTSLMEGIGEVLTPYPITPLHAVLIYPEQSCSTKDIFENLETDFSHNVTLPENPDDIIPFLIEQENDLTNTAISVVPEIQNALNVLSQESRCLLSRMSGSGSACFGLFLKKDESINAAEKIQHDHPNWWVRSAILQ